MEEINRRNQDIKAIKKEKTRKEFLAGFVAGLVCFGIVAIVLLLVFSL